MQSVQSFAASIYILHPYMESAGFKDLGDKVEGHEDRIRFLERKVA